MCRLIGNSLASILKVLTSQITCSTNMDVFSTFFVLISSDGTISYVPLSPGGIYNERLYDIHSFSILKTLSGTIVEYNGNFSKSFRNIGFFLSVIYQILHLYMPLKQNL